MQRGGAAGGAPTARHAQSPLGALTLIATPQGGTAVPRGSPRSRALHGEGPPRVAHHPPLPGPGWGRGGTQSELTAGLRSTRGLAGARAQLAAPTRCDERPVLSRRVGVGGLGVSGCGDGATTPQRGRVGTTGERRRNGKAPTAPIRTGKGSRSEVLCNQKQLWEGGTKPRGEKERGCGARRGMGRPQPRASRCPCSRAQQRGPQGGGRRLHRPPRRRAGRDGRSAQEKGSRGGGPSMRSLLPPRSPHPRIGSPLQPRSAEPPSPLRAPRRAGSRRAQRGGGRGGAEAGTGTERGGREGGEGGGPGLSAELRCARPVPSRPVPPCRRPPSLCCSSSPPSPPPRRPPAPRSDPRPWGWAAPGAPPRPP